MTDEPTEIKEKPVKKIKGDPFGAIFWGLVLVWFGISNYLIKANWLNWFIFGLGLIFIADGLLRQFWSEMTKPIKGKYITGVILIVVGLALTYWSKDWWPLIPIIVGAGIFIAGITRIRESEGT